MNLISAAAIALKQIFDSGGFRESLHRGDFLRVGQLKNEAALIISPLHAVMQSLSWRDFDRAAAGKSEQHRPWQHFI